MSIVIGARSVGLGLVLGYLRQCSADFRSCELGWEIDTVKGMKWVKSFEVLLENISQPILAFMLAEVTIVLAWTEDKALRGRNLSAAPRLKAMGRAS